MNILGVTKHIAASIYFSAISGINVALLFLILARRGGALQALILCLFYMSTAAFIFWTAIPETFTLGTTSILLSLLLLHSRHQGLAIFASAFSLGITLTNWVAGLYLKVKLFGLKKAMVLSGAVFLSVFIINILHTSLYTSAGLITDMGQEVSYMRDNYSTSTPLERGKVLFAYSLLYPGNYEIKIREGDQPMLSIQHQPLAENFISLSIIVFWLALIAYAVIQTTEWGAPLIASSQILLHLAFGLKTFLFVTPLMPLFIIIASNAFTEGNRKFLTLCIGIITPYLFL